jgi:4-aminobutyrate aminotransferase / (S)-3-amino-2-methylpropionate transaminase / 5-aminovalerate transaminase
VGTIDLKTDIPGPKSKAVLDRARVVVPEALTIHAPVVIDRGEGPAITDIDGNTLLDFSGGLGCHIVGYSHPKVVEAVQGGEDPSFPTKPSVAPSDFSVIPYESYVDLAERLIRLTGGGDRRVFLANSGAEAVENAVKIARVATGRPAILCFEGGFHGRTLLTMTLTSRHAPYKTGYGPFAPEIYRLPYPYPYRSAHPDESGALALEAIERAFTTVVDPATVAAAIVEPIQGEGGFVVPPPEFLSGLQSLLRRHGILVIADEIQTGCGRTGTFLASEQLGLEPDLVTLAKSLASGYPLSAVVGRAEVMDAPGDSSIGGTYVGNPVACAAGSAVLQVIEEGGLLDRAEQVGKQIRSRWEEVAGEVDQIGEVRGVGAMIGVEFVEDRESKAPNKHVVSEITTSSTRRGVVSVSCGIYKNVLRHLVPLVITDEQLAEGLDVLADTAVAAATG